MDGFEFNKIAAAILIALLTLKTVDLVSDGLVHPKKLEKNAFEIEGVEAEEKKDGAVAAAPEPIEPLLATADVKNGENVFKKCAVCHTADKGGANKVGPNLHDVVGRKVGSHEGFAYSAAMSGHGGEWGYKELSDYVENPKTYVPGNKMAFAGIKKAKDRADLIAYLRTQSDAPKPLP